MPRWNPNTVDRLTTGLAAVKLTADGAVPRDTRPSTAGNVALLYDPGEDSRGP